MDTEPDSDGDVGTEPDSDGDVVNISELSIERAPGFETGGFDIDGFSPGVNLVYGPNAAGKTTTAEALIKVLWPETALGGERIVGHLSMGETRWRVDVTNGRAEYQRDGLEAAGPTLPPSDHRDRYRLSLHDLLQRETRNESFAETIDRESAGGYDLAAAHGELGYKDAPITRRPKVYSRAEDAVGTWREERSEAKGLEEERSRLTTLRYELAEARAGRDGKEAIEQAIDYREARSEHEAAKAAFAEFPDTLEGAVGNEYRRVEDLDAEIDEWEAEREAAEEKRCEANEALAEAALPVGGLPDGFIDRLKERRDSLNGSESRKREIEEELAGAKAKRTRSRADVPLDIGHDDLADLDPGSWADVSEFARTAERVHAERQRREAIRGWADTEPDPESDPRTLERGSKALENWLMAGEGTQGAAGGEAAFRIGTVSAVAVSLSSVALGVLVEPLLFGAVLGGIALFAYGYLLRDGEERDGNARASHRESFEQTGLPEPPVWSRTEVQDRLVAIYDELARHAVSEERRRQWDAILAERDPDGAEAALERKREELQKGIGAAPETADIELAVLVRRILDWQGAHEDVIRLRAELETVDEHLEEERNTLRSELREFGDGDVMDEDGDVMDSASATGWIRELERRGSVHENATRELTGAERTIAKANGKLTELRDRQAELATTLVEDPDDREALKSICDQVDEYEEARRAVERTEAVAERERERLEALPAFDPEWKGATLSELKRRLRDVEEIASRHDDIQEAISGIEGKIRQAKSETSIETSIAEKDRALDALADQRADDYAAMVGDVLVEHVRDETIAASRPAVFQRANELLATITYGRYELDLADGDGTFRAYDTTTRKGVALDELSSGTRLQVLLAVRVAFVELQERGAKLPIFLDETLANSDDRRAEVIIGSLIELAGDGRQIFYFTAQGDEVTKWRAALDDAGDVESTTIDLWAKREGNGSVAPPEIGRIDPIAPTPPDPADHDHGSYGEACDVEVFNPHDGVGTAHLWYVVEDVNVLHALLEVGIERWGQLETILERGRNGIIPAGADALRRIQQNAEALDGFVQAWRIGRGDPVDRSVLEASGAVSETFIDRVSDLAAEVGGDAERLVDALHDGKVRRFRDDKTEELEEYLRANGYLVHREPLEDDEIRIRTIERLVGMDVPRERAAERSDDLLRRVANG